MSTVKLLDIEKFARRYKEVTSTDIWISKGTFHPDGLFSETIFGPIETPARKETFGYIDLNTRVIHPALISIIKRMNRNLISAINRENHYTLNELGYLVPKEDGEIYGLTAVLDNFNKMKFRGGSEKRDDLVDMLNHYRKVGLFFVSKIPVMPVAFRDIIIKADGKIDEDPINNYYKPILVLSLQLKTIPSGAIFDVLSSNMQEAVHALYEYISDKISTKQGLIRHDILGKRIDFSARAVVTGAGSELKSDEIGIPFKVCTQLFEPFILYQLLSSKNIPKDKLAKELYDYTKQELSVSSLRNLLNSINKGDEIPIELDRIIRAATNFALLDKVVIAKRDPVLHSEGTMAFKPVLVDGDSIRLNPLFCDGYNADFDGDQMALFVPLTKESIQEIKDKMITTESKRGYFKSSMSFSKDSIAGLWALTRDPKIKPVRYPIVKSEKELNEFEIYNGVTYKGIKTTVGRVIFNLECLPNNFPFYNEALTSKKFKALLAFIFKKYSHDIFRTCCDNFLRLGFKYYTIAPATFSLDDLEIPASLYKLKAKLKGADPETAQKILTQMETELAAYLRKKDLGLAVVAESGTAKGGYGQLRQVLVAKGLIADVSGNILPAFSSSYADGLESKEFFAVSPGTRKGIVNRALNTATTGYLTRQLIYALQSVEVDNRIHDCGTKRTLDIVATPEIATRLTGRYIVTKSGEMRLFDEKNDVNKLIKLRSPMYCRTKKLCMRCYGNLAIRNTSPYVGVIAANIVGERGTQLIMRTFHTGGAVGITSIDLLKSITDIYDETRKNLFSKIFKQVDTSLVANADGEITVKRSDFMEPNDDIVFGENKLDLAYGYFSIKIGSIDFDIALDFQTTINIFHGYDDTRTEQLVIPFKKDETIFVCKPASSDFTQTIKVVTRTLSGKTAWKDANHFLLKVFDIYLKAESDADFVHFEVLVSNLMRDKTNPRIPARLNQREYNPIVVNIKEVPVLTSWLLSLEFENFNKSIENSLIYQRPEEETILEKLVTGNL